MHKKLTAYLSTLEADGFGKWIVDTESRGTVDNPIQMPYVSYSRMVKQFVNDVYAFADEHQEYDLYRYNIIFAENGIEWDRKSMCEKDVSTLGGKCIVALIMGAVRAERFADGALLNFFHTGTITKWLKRLQEIDEKSLDRNEQPRPFLYTIVILNLRRDRGKYAKAGKAKVPKR